MFKGYLGVAAVLFILGGGGQPDCALELPRSSSLVLGLMKSVFHH